MVDKMIIEGTEGVIWSYLTASMISSTDSDNYGEQQVRDITEIIIKGVITDLNFNENIEQRGFIENRQQVLITSTELSQGDIIETITNTKYRLVTKAPQYYNDEFVHYEYSLKPIDIN